MFIHVLIIVAIIGLFLWVGTRPYPYAYDEYAMSWEHLYEIAEQREAKNKCGPIVIYFVEKKE